jgi:hypothetical protein
LNFLIIFKGVLYHDHPYMNQIPEMLLWKFKYLTDRLYLLTTFPEKSRNETFRMQDNYFCLCVIRVTLYTYILEEKKRIYFVLTKKRAQKDCQRLTFFACFESSQKYILYFPTICIFNADMIYYIYIFLHLLMKITVPINNVILIKPRSLRGITMYR